MSPDTWTGQPSGLQWVRVPEAAAHWVRVDAPHIHLAADTYAPTLATWNDRDREGTMRHHCTGAEAAARALELEPLHPALLRPLSGRRAAQLAARMTHSHFADDLYRDAAAILGLYGAAFFGHRATPAERRKLREAWREARAIAALHGALPPSFTTPRPPTEAAQ